MFGKNNREAPSYHTETRFLEKDLGSNRVEKLQLLLFKKSEAKQGLSLLNAKLFVSLGSFPQTQLHLKYSINS